MTALDYRSAATPTDQPSTERSRGHWLLWAIYLAMSWTWCIGMFLPVLLVRDFGFWGWVVFAIPNVIGAGAMAWVLDGRTSAAAVRAHSAAMRAFSFVTVIFQIFFGVWLFTDWFDHPLISLLLVVIGAVTFLVSFARWSLYAPLAVAAVSYWSASKIILHGGSFAQPFKIGLERSPLSLLGLAFSCIFGFGLCPYLDLTFHRARGTLPSNRAARSAFAVGFGVFFLSMIAFSLLYSPPLVLLLSGAIVFPFLAAHFLGQLGFTIGVHWRELLADDGCRSIVRWLLVVATILLGFVIAGVLSRFSDPLEALVLGEQIYRLFMGFYGLVFPAYVWLCMIPGGWVTPPTRRQVIVWAVAVIIAAPMFWMAFIRGQMMWAVPGVGVALASRIAVRGTPRATLA
jgi:hypothetical protein